MDKICQNCLNAYNSPYSPEVFCINKEWESQFNQDIKVTVRRDESCGTFQQREVTQPKLVFGRPVQLELF